MKNEISDLEINRELIAKYLEEFNETLSEFKSDLDLKNELVSVITDSCIKIKTLNETILSPFKLVIVGAQGSGKSTLVNLLLKESAMISTFKENEGVVIKLVFTEDENLLDKVNMKYLSDEPNVYKQELIDKKLFNQIVDISKSDEIITNPKYSNLLYAEFYSDNELLKRVEIINTPGIYSITKDFLPKIHHLFIEADIIMWMNIGNKILDAFNTDLIRLISRDNKNIVGIICMADELYEMNREKGVYDVIKQFLEVVEKNILFRVKVNNTEKIALFAYNGFAAKTSYGMVKNPDIMIEDINNIHISEDKNLRMIYNYLSKGFPFADSNRFDIYSEFNLFSHDSLSPQIHIYDKEYEQKTLINILIEKEFISKQNNKLYYTDIGKKLLLDSSMLVHIEDFAENYIFSNKLDEKIKRVMESYKLLYEEDNIYKRLISVRNDLFDELNKTNESIAKDINDINIVKNLLKKEFNKWRDERLFVNANNWGSIIIENIIKRIDEEIDKKILLKELLTQTVGIFNKNKKEGPAIQQINRIVEESFNKIIEDNTDILIDESLSEINNILLEIGHGKIKTEGLQYNKGYTKVDILPKSPVDIDLSKLRHIIDKIRDIILKKVKEIVVKKLKDIAKTDLRKFPKAKFIKFFIKLLRKILKKVSEEQIKELLGKAATGLGWLSLFWDLANIPFIINNMLKEIKLNLKKSMTDNKSEFINNFKDVFSPIYDECLNQVNLELDSSVSISSDDVLIINKNIEKANNIIEVFQYYKNKLNDLYEK